MKRFRLFGWSDADKQKAAAAESMVVDGVVLNGPQPADDKCGGGGGGGKFYGIKSYLHSFYVAGPPTIEQIEAGKGQGATWYLLPPPPAQRMGLYVCRLLTVLGLLLLLAGSAAIIIGYCLPQEQNIEGELMRISIDQDEEGNFYVLPERLTEVMAQLQDPMHKWKMIGFCVFAAGASLMALSLLVPMLAQCCGGSRLAAFASGDNTPNEPPVRIYPGGGAQMPGNRFKVVPAKFAGSHKISPTNAGPVPVMEEISKVQPGSKCASKGASPVADEQLLIDQLVDSSDAQPLIR